MPITAQWYNEEKTISMVHFHGGFDFSAVLEAWDMEIDLQNTVSHPVYSINLFEHVPLSLKGMNIRELHHFAKSHPPQHLQMVVQVAEDDMLRSILRTVAPKTSYEFHIVTSLDDAYALIQAHKAANSTNA